MKGSVTVENREPLSSEGDAVQELAGLKNLGLVSARWLVAAGIRSVDELERIGAVEAYRRVIEHFPDNSSVLLLYALQGALWDAHWNELSPATRTQLKEAAKVAKAGKR